MKLLVRAPILEKDLEKLKKYFSEVIYDPWTLTGVRYYEDEMIDVLIREQPDGIITELDEITEKVLENYKGLKFIGDCRATPENISVKSCTDNSIPLFCTPGRNAQAVAEMWLSTLIAYMRNLVPSIKWMQENKWVEGTTPYYLFRGNELYGKHIGFVGMGAVPQTISKLLEPFNCKISYYDPFLNTNINRCNKETLENIFKNCDCVSVHLPLNKDTEKMIDKTFLNLLRSSSIFINSSRSPVVDNEALYKILKQKSIGGAIIDVFDKEPPINGKTDFDDLENVLLTPHIYGATYEVENHQSKIITDKIIGFLEEKDLAGIIFNRDLLK